jgi:uncharacterized protein (DUF433 family)
LRVVNARGISISPEIMGGKPVIAGTRVTVARVLELLSEGLSVQQLLKEYPHISEADVRACLAYGASLAAGEEIAPLLPSVGR